MHFYKLHYFKYTFSFYFVIYIHIYCIKVHIEFTEGEDKITLEGPTKDVQMVQSQIEAIVTDLVSTEIPVQLCLGTRPRFSLSIKMVHVI